jgi:thiamine-phosphate pyrophosphorylase
VVFADRASRFYPVIDTALCAARGLEPRAVAEACLHGGARLLQLRVKAAPSAVFLALTDDVVAAAAPFGAAVIVNDRADIAVMARAHGVHVGQDDLAAEAVRPIVGGAVIGLSTHDARQVDAALSSVADYLAVGPIFDTATKDTGYEARGLELVRYAARKGKPVVAIGGMTLERAPAVIAAGAASVAVISDVLATGAPEERVRDYLRALA